MVLVFYVKIHAYMFFSLNYNPSHNHLCLLKHCRLLLISSMISEIIILRGTDFQRLQRRTVMLRLKYLPLLNFLMAYKVRKQYEY